MSDAIRRVSSYVKNRQSGQLKGIGDEIHTIHTTSGTDSVNVPDLAELLAEITRLQGENERLKKLANIKCGFECTACGGYTQGCLTALQEKIEGLESENKTQRAALNKGEPLLIAAANHIEELERKTKEIETIVRKVASAKG